MLKPHKFTLRPRFARPTHKNDIDYYTDPAKRGYLANQDAFRKKFVPRGYVGLDGIGAGQTFSTVQVKYIVKGTEDKWNALRLEREKAGLVEYIEDAPEVSEKDVYNMAAEVKRFSEINLE